MRKLILALLAVVGTTAFAAPVPPSSCPNCVLSTDQPQNAQINIGTATIRGTLTVSTVTVSYFHVADLTVTNIIGSGAGLTSLNASQLTSGTVPSARITGAYTGITTLGTITGGTWNGAVVGTQYGGTGQNFSNVAQGNIPYFSGLGLMTTLTPGTVNMVLQTGGAGANPSWTGAPTLLGTNVTQIPLANLVTGGTLPTSIGVADASLTSVSGSKIVGNIGGNAANITGTLAIGQLGAGNLAADIVAQTLDNIGTPEGTFGGPDFTAQIAVNNQGRVISITQFPIPTISSSSLRNDVDNNWQHSQTSQSGSSWTIHSTLAADFLVGNGAGITGVTATISAGSIDTTKLASDSVTTVKILNANVTTAKIAALAVDTGKLATDAVTTSKVLNAAITPAKLSLAYLPLTGGTLSGALAVTGTSVTANAFFGDGSHLTGVTASIPGVTNVRSLQDASFVDALVWSSRQLYDSTGQLSQNWTTRRLYDTLGFIAVDYDAHELKTSAGLTPIKWSGPNIAVSTNIVSSSSITASAFFGDGSHLSGVSSGVCSQGAGSSSVLCLGGINVTPGIFSTVSGGYGNNATGHYSSIPGGYGNSATGIGGYALGATASASENGCFNWNDGANGPKDCHGFVNSYNVHASNRVYFDAPSSTFTGNLYASFFYGDGSGLTNLPSSGICTSGVGSDSVLCRGTPAGLPNTANGQYATDSGGVLNTSNGFGCTVAGGNDNDCNGDQSAIGGGYSHTANGLFDTIAGGRINTTSGDKSTVGGGEINTASADHATVAGGYNNMASGILSVVIGGETNLASGVHSVVLGGLTNTASGTNSIASGRNATANQTDCYVWSGGALADCRGIAQSYNVTAAGGGFFDAPSSTFTGNLYANSYFGSGAGLTGVTATIGAGSIDTTKLATDAVTNIKIINGAVDTNKLATDAVTTVKVLNAAITPAKLSQAYLPLTGGTITGAVSMTGAGSTLTTQSSVTASAFFGDGSQLTGIASSSICGSGTGSDSVLCRGTPAGLPNTASGQYATDSGGVLNTSNGFGCTVAGGNDNDCNGDQSAIGGGYSHTAGGTFNTISGGRINSTSGDFSTVSGGQINTASNDHATVSGGYNNMASGLLSVVIGGETNLASGTRSVVLGGLTNVSSGDNSVASGRNATADANDCYIWANGTAASCGAVNGSYNIQTDTFTVSGAAAHAGQAACWTTGGKAGYCTSVVGVGGGCTCAGF